MAPVLDFNSPVRPSGQSDSVYFRVISWKVKHPPRQRHRDSIPPFVQKNDPFFGICYSGLDITIYPAVHSYSKVVEEHKLHQASLKLKRIPPTISSELLRLHAAPSIEKVLKTLYKISYYKPDWKGRYCEPSIGRLSKITGLSDRSIKYVLAFLRKGWFIRLIWRGRPDSLKPRYHHSCYELPFNFKHVLSWRIHKRRIGKK